MNLATTTSLIYWIGYQRKIKLLGDFNIDLLNYHQHSPTNKFLDSLSSHMLLSHIVQPTGIRNNSKTLIVTIFAQM